MPPNSEKVATGLLTLDKPSVEVSDPSTRTRRWNQNFKGTNYMYNIFLLHRSLANPLIYLRASIQRALP